MRKIEPAAGDAKDRPVFYDAVNAGKTVRRMNLKQPEIRAEFLRRVADHDVLLEGFRPGVMQRLGLGFSVLRKINPGLIVCSLSGYGAAGPSAQAAGHDANYLAASGIMHRNARNIPFFYDPPMADVSGSLFAVIAILGALRAREADGLGCEIDIGLADVPMPLQLFQIAEYGPNGTVPQPGKTYLNGGAAYYQVYATRDGRHIAMGGVEAKFWSAFCVAAGRPDWEARQAEALPQTALIADVAALMRAMTLAECGEKFAAGDCCVRLVLDLGEAIASPHYRDRGLVRRAPDGALQALFPSCIDGQPPDIRQLLQQAQHEGQIPSCR